MERLAKVAGWLRDRVTFSAKSPDPEPINAKPREMVGFFAGLTAEQKKAALDYEGPENHGSAELRSRRS